MNTPKRKVSITLEGWELELIQHALEVWMLMSRDRVARTFSARERNRMIRVSLRLICDQVVKQKPAAAILAGHFTFLSNEEAVAFNAAEAKKANPPKPALEASPFQMDWFREHFPGRCI